VIYDSDFQTHFYSEEKV